MKVLWMLSFIIFVSITIAETPESALTNYYKYYKEEDLDGYYSYVYTSDLNPSQLNARKEITQTIWNKFDVLDYSLIIHRTEQSSGKAVVSYSLSFEVSDGEHKFTHSDDYYAYLINENGWKVKQIYQKDEIFELIKQGFIDTQEGVIEDVNNFNENKQVPLAGSEQTSPVGCKSDEECKEKGYYACEDGKCVGYEDNICLLSILPFLSSMFFLFRR